MPYQDYELDLQNYFAGKVVEWRTDPVTPIDLPVSWPNVILKEEDYDKTKPWLKFVIIEARSFQPSMGRDENCTFKRIEGQIVIDIFYPYNYGYLDLSDIMNKVEDVLQQVRIAGHTLTDTSYRINRHEARGMKAKRIYTSFETNLNK